MADLREVAVAAAKVEQWRRRRDDAIRSALEHSSARAVGTAAGLSHVAVLKIAKRK